MALKWFKKKKNTKPADVSVQTEDATEKMAALPVSESEPASHHEDGETVPPSEDSRTDPIPADFGSLNADAAFSPAVEKDRATLFSRLKSGLSKTRQILTTDIDELFLGKKLVDDDMLEVLEERLITADMGVQTTLAIMDKLSGKRSRIADANALKDALKAEILTCFENLPELSASDKTKPHVVMVVGVNGVGKTTTIGKLAARESRNGKKVLIAAADTFRAAAIEQISIWAKRAGADIVRHKDNADPAAVAYDGVDAAISRGADIVFVDTAGRLHTKVNLMEEIRKIQRTLAKRLSGAPHEVLLVLDATTGQNALAQAKMFDEALGVTGIALTKLDGTAKGGIVVSICDTLKIPLNYIGVGEGVDDLQLFDANRFVDALFQG
ncbi:signal recognition particle-docking protein FtsY [Desulfosarcina sp. OttesenSCG-928-A07]|nr:signal recognition particle-docking protein FtsY [Desulfosarcina sp. OttesenSCG-928-A07]